MAQALWMRLREEKWQDYQVSQGAADRLPKVLQDLASRKRTRSMKSCHEVWKLLCSGGVHSAAVIVVPYLVEILHISTEEVQMEIADILRDCAVNSTAVDAQWGAQLQSVLLEQLPHILRVSKKASGDTAIAYSGAVEAIDGLR